MEIEIEAKKIQEILGVLVESNHQNDEISKKFIAWKVSKYGVFSGLNTGKYGLEKNPYLDTFQAAVFIMESVKIQMLD